MIPKLPNNALRLDVYLFFVCLYVKFFRVLCICQFLSQGRRPHMGAYSASDRETYGANSPSLCPTMSSVMVMSW
jgi:hypothetical protein